MSNVHVRLRKQLLWLILDKPPLNLLTIAMLEQLTLALHNALQQPPLLIVFTGAGDSAFCEGVDIPDDTDAQRTALVRATTDICTALEELRAQSISTVALVKGNAFGAGCELVALCDTVIAHEGALFRLPTVNAKTFPCAISKYLPASIGQEATTRLMQSGETPDAKEAMRLGLVQQVLPAQRFLSDTEELLVMLATVASQKR